MSLVIIAVLSLLIGRLAAIALTVTGIPREIARFQARSALTGAGFTTTESEAIVNHPARRRIIMFLMLVGSLGTAAVIAGLIGSFARVSGVGHGLRNGLVLVAGMLVVLWLTRVPALDRVLSRLFAGIVKRYTAVDIRDYASLLHLSGEYAIQEVFVEEGDWIAETTLADLDLPHEGVLVLGIVRADGAYLGAPKGATTAHKGDTLIVYGRVPVLSELDERRAGTTGDRAHRLSILQQRAEEARQQEQAS